MLTKESKFQADVIKSLKSMFPECIVLKNDPNYIQGIPDLLILHNDKWAALECKRSKDSPARPNQKYYIDKMSNMSYASVIYPENREEVFNELSQSLESSRTTCVFGSEQVSLD